MSFRSRIRKTTAYLQPIAEDAPFFITMAVKNVPDKRMKIIGFTKIEPGIEILPRAIGSVSRYNANGRYIIHKDQPKITKYRTFEAPGFHNSVHEVTVSYKSYPRTFEAGPEIHLTIIENDGELLISSPKLNKKPENENINKHMINLFYDLFGEFQLKNEHMQAAFIDVPIRRLDWTLLPMGEYPWSRIEAEGLLPRDKNGTERPIRHTDDVIRRFKPESCAIGNGGFKGYVAFCFPDKGICLLENFFHGNATYVFNQNWEELSKQTKATIIQGQLALKRIEHRKGWENEVIRILS